MKRSAALLLVLPVLLAFVGGCRSVAPALAGLNASLAEVRRDASGRIEATLRINNPNLAAYNIARSEHRVFLDDRAVGEIEIAQPMGVPPQNFVTREVEIKASREAESTIAAALARGSARFRVESTLVIQLYGDSRETFRSRSDGTVAVVSKK